MAQGGVTLNDRKLAAGVRSEVLTALQLVLKGDKSVDDWSDFKKKIIEKMSTTILPRINEVTGEDGGDIKVAISGMKIIKDVT